MKQQIKIDMLGGLTLRIGKKVLLETAGKINKPWQVFCYLLLARGQHVPSAQLIAALWPDENLADPNNVLKNTIYALRREFKEAEGTLAKPVLFESGGYILNTGIEFLVDAERFEAFCTEAGAATGDEQKITLLQSATALYKGPLLPQLSGEIWVLPRNIYLKKLYNESVNALCELLYETGRYSELLAEATAANRIDPLDEDYYLHMFRALFALGMYRVMVPLYQKTSKMYTEQLGITLCDEIRSLYAAASEKINPIEQDIMIIKDDLSDVTYDGNTPEGPLYCTYDVFKYLYQMVARTAERTGSCILIILLSLQDRDGGQPADEALPETMGHLKDELLGGLLRKSDTVARYSKSQYIMMLSSDQATGAQPVVERLERVCGAYVEKQGLRMLFSTTELGPAEK